MKKLLIVLMILSMPLLIAADVPDTSTLQELLGQVLTAVVALTVAAIGTYGTFLIKKGLEWLEAKIGTNQLEWLKEYASTSVEAFAQNPAFKEMAGSDIKQLVIQEISEYCTAHKLPFTEAVIDNAVEQAYYWFKYTTKPASEP